MTEESGDLLARFRAGEAQAFDRLVADLGPRLIGYFIRQGAETSTAEDLTQHVFLRVLQGLERYQESGRLDAYFLRIARNLWIDHRRRRPLHSFPEHQREPSDPAPGPRDDVEQRDRVDCLRLALTRLEPAERELLELAILQRLPYREVGSILGIPVGTVKSRVFYTLRRMRADLAHLDPDSGGDSE